jgi:acyl-CoA synthetase (AMP-forming)/AMP-acid ligase II
MPRFDLELFLRLIQEHRATRLYIVPPVALGAGQAPDGGRVRHVLGRGSVFRRRAAGPETEIAVGERLGALSVQGYGMTEMSPISHMTIGGNVRHGSSGQAVPSTECRIVNPETLTDMPRARRASSGCAGRR